MPRLEFTQPLAYFQIPQTQVNSRVDPALASVEANFSSGRLMPGPANLTYLDGVLSMVNINDRSESLATLHSY